MKIPNLLEIVEALKYGSAHGHHPENAFAQADNREKVEWYVSKNEEACSRLRKLADDLEAQPPGALRHSFFRQFDTTGARDDYQAQYFACWDRLNAAAMAYYLFREDRYLSEAQDAVWAICDEYTWCLPAHLAGRSLQILPNKGDAEEKDGRIVPYLYSHRNTLDLFACETAKHLAETVRLLGPAMHADVRHRAVTEIIQRVFSQYLTFNRIHGFELERSNWSAVCGGSVGIAAIYLIDDELLLAPVVQRVISDLDVFLSSYGEDGIGREGLGYWRYGFSNLCMFADLLKERTHGRLDLFREEKVKKVSFFPAASYLYKNYCVNFSDCDRQYECPAELVSYLKGIYPDMPELTALSVRPEGGKERDLPVTLRKIFWERDLEGKVFRERSEFYPDAAWLVSCTETPRARLSFVIKGGNNSEPHNHNDLGHFILMADGEVLLCDLGSGLYTKDYFGENRYKYLVNSSRGHSVPMIDGSLQAQGSGSRAEILEVQTGTDQDGISMELASAYPVKGLESFVRTASVDRKNQSIRLTDTYLSKQKELRVTERFVSGIPPVTDGGDVVISGKNHALRIKSTRRPLEVLIQKEEFPMHDAKFGTAYLIDFVFLLEREQETTDFIFELLE